MDSGLTPIDGAGPTASGLAHRHEHPPTPPAPIPAASGPAAAFEPAAEADARDDAGSRGARAYAEYRVDPASGQVRIQIRDAASNDVLREIPSEESARAAGVIQAYLNAGQTRRTPAGQEG